MVDLAPTILDIAGLPPLRFAQGRSLLPRIRKPGLPGEEVYIWEAIRNPQWKYVKPRHELFDLKADPGEQHNLADSRPDILEHMDGILNRCEEEAIAFRDRLPGHEDPGETGLNRQEREQLHALGYLSDSGNTGDH